MNREPRAAPKPYYTLINTSRGSDPAVVVVNSALRQFRFRDHYPWHLRVVISAENLARKGMPTSAEQQVLYRVEDGITDVLLESDNVIYVATVTCRGRRELVLRVKDPDQAEVVLERLVSAPRPERQWEYSLQHDPEWRWAQAELALLD